MLQLKNTTPFKAALSLFPNENGVDHLYVVIKASFNTHAGVALAEEQQAIQMEDAYWGEPGTSSLKVPSELHLTKPSTDILMVGDACAPFKDLVHQLDVKLQIDNHSKTARVFGDRHWKSSVFGLQISEPEPFEAMPLVYERAFGGFHQADDKKQQLYIEERNPVGRGFKGKRKNKEFKDTLLPNIEDPHQLITKPNDQPTPLCFGPVAATWEPRKSHAGTYDQAWQKTQAPYLPKDFDNRFFNTAHPDLISNGYLLGGEKVQIENMNETGPISFKLPKCDLDLQITVQGKKEAPPLNLETLFLEPTMNQFSMTWRAAMACDKAALKIEQVDIALNNLYLE
ncbi:MAG: DUF2169 domain-containing protein [Pseudomonadales bacterium]|nr:DUF2169 domain-containing protein [Pseudomonadales bacterium]